MELKCKRIIGGKTYNTETSTHIEGRGEDVGPYEWGEHLYQSRHGAFFLYKFQDGMGETDYQTIVPMSPDEAQQWLEEHFSYRPDLIESLFGEMPEAGQSEVKYTLRLAESLQTRLKAAAKENGQSLNAWMVRCLERCSTSDK